MHASELMGPPVLTVRPHLPARDAAAQLARHRCTAAPVVDAEGRVRGVLTEADLMRGCLRHGRRVEDGPTVADLMRPVPTGMAPGTDLATVVAYMLRSGVHVVPILDGGRLVGVLGAADVLRLAAGPRPGPPRRAAPVTAP